MYTPIYYQTISDLGIDPVVAGFGPPVVAVEPPAQLAPRAAAKASEGKPRVPRKRAPKKATGAGVSV